jgi:SAM-dependent methyltransferase
MTTGKAHPANSRPSNSHGVKSHEALVGGQFGARAAAYLGSAVHAQGADLQALAYLVRGQSGARVLDLGAGAGHVSFHVAPEVSEVVACDLSPEMLDIVAHSASERGLRNISTRQGVAEDLPATSITSSPASAPITGMTSTPDCAKSRACSGRTERPLSSTAFRRVRRYWIHICRRWKFCAIHPMCAVTRVRNGTQRWCGPASCRLRLIIFACA